MQPRVARSGNRSPAAVAAIDKQHVIEFVNRLEAHDERRIPMLFENDRGAQRGFETMRGSCANDAAKRSERGGVWRRLGVVGQPVEK